MECQELPEKEKEQEKEQENETKITPQPKRYRPLKMTVMPSVKPVESNEPPKKYKVFYSDQVHKKHKVYEEGLLELTKTKLKLCGEDGALIMSAVRPKLLKDEWTLPFTSGKFYSIARRYSPFNR